MELREYTRMPFRSWFVRRPGAWLWRTTLYDAETLRDAVFRGEIGLEWLSSPDQISHKMPVSELLQTLEKLQDKTSPSALSIEVLRRIPLSDIDSHSSSWGMGLLIAAPVVTIVNGVHFGTLAGVFTFFSGFLGGIMLCVFPEVLDSLLRIDSIRVPRETASKIMSK